MIKNIYYKFNQHYYHEYYCDNCFCEIENWHIFRHNLAIEMNMFDLCEKCYNYFQSKLKKIIEDNIKTKGEMVEMLESEKLERLENE